MNGVNWSSRLMARFSRSVAREDSAVRPAFHDAAVQRQFDCDGFVVVPFIDPERLEQLRQLFATVDSGIGSGFYVSLHSSDVSHRVAVGEGLQRICGDLPARYLRDYRMLVGTFAVKFPGPGSEQGAHQDLSFVDESRFASVNCWFPLTEVGADDGPLMVMKGSHRLFPKNRGPFQPLFHRPGLRDVIVSRYLIAPKVKVGEAILFNSRLVHYSPPSTGARARVAVLLSTIPREVEPRFFYTHPDGGIEVFKVAADFFYRFDPRAEPADGTSLGRLSEAPPVITETDIARFYRQHPELR